MILPGWRARIEAAEKRGSFDRGDFEAALTPGACMVGERARFEGLKISYINLTAEADHVFGDILGAVKSQNFSLVRRYLRFVEEAGTIVAPPTGRMQCDLCLDGCYEASEPAGRDYHRPAPACRYVEREAPLEAVA